MTGRDAQRPCASPRSVANPSARMLETVVAGSPAIMLCSGMVALTWGVLTFA